MSHNGQTHLKYLAGKFVKFLSKMCVSDPFGTICIKELKPNYTQLTFTCSNSTIETLAKSLKYAQS